MAHGNRQDGDSRIFTLWSGRELTSSGYTVPVLVSSHDMGSFQFYWEGADQIDGLIVPQVSNFEPELGRWVDLVDATIDSQVLKICEASGNHMYELTEMGYRYIRFYLNHGSNTAGTIDAVFLIKRRA